MVPFERDAPVVCAVGLLCERDAGTRFRTFAAALQAEYRIVRAVAPAAPACLAPRLRPWT